MIKVLIVDDSPSICSILRRTINKEEDMEVVGSAGDPYQARELILKFQPDVMTVDVEMPKMDGLEFIRKLLPQYPIPTIVVSSLARKNSTLAFDALESGAVAFVQKPQLAGAQTDIRDFFKALLHEIRLASKADVSRLKKLNFDIRRVPKSEFRLISSRTTDKVIVMGASTGGTTALTFLLKQFPSNMPGTVIVQHMPPGFTARFAERLNDECSISVKEAKNGDIVKQGEVLIAPGGLHLKLVKKGRDIAVETFDGPRLHGVIPSVDYLFLSAADVLKERAIAVILTGMGDDGAKAMAQLRVSGAYTIAQDKETSLIYGMPAAAVDAGGVTVSLPLDKITEEIIRRL